MTSLAVTVIGRDRPGIIAEVTGVVAELGGNIEDSSMTLLRNHFAWTLIADLDVPPEELTERLAHLQGDGLVVAVLPVTAHEPFGGAPGFLLSVRGTDRPGIVASVTGVLAAHGANITDLSTRLGGSGLYLLTAELSLPEGTDVVALGAELAEVGNGLGVEVRLHAADADLL